MSQVADFVGRVVGGRYRLVSPAGTGSSAHVYRAEDARLGRTVAIKMLHGALAADPTFLKRFRAEAKAAAALNHPHVMRVFDWGDDASGPYLVLEYLGGGSLAALIDAGFRLSPAQAARVGLEAARALDYAHRRGLVHRDVKPANILFDEEGRTALADFGLARALAEAAWTEPAGTLFGTARYTSPEQAQGRPAEGRSDVYSLGLSLYESLVGEIPFRGDSTVSLVMARVGAHVEPPEASGLLGVVLEGAMAPDATDRIDAARLVEELVIAQRNLPSPEPLPLAGNDGAQRSAPEDLTVLGTPDEAGTSPSTSAGTDPGLGGEPGTHPVTAVRAAGRGRREGRSHEVKDAGGSTSGHPGVFRRLSAPARRILVAAVVAAALAVAGGAAYETKMFATKYPVPILDGMTVAAARAAATDHHFHLVVTSHRFDKATPAGRVASQSPKAGSRSPGGSDLDVVISKGPPAVALPTGLVGRSEAAAAAALGAAGLKPATAGVFSQSVPPGAVVAITPSTGLHWGQSVTLQVSQGPQPVTMPTDLAGEDPAAATAELQNLGLTVNQSRQNSSTVPTGQVIGTNPAQGQTVHQGDAVTLIVSKGPVFVAVPDVTGESVDKAVAALKAAGLTAENVYGPPGGNATVFATDPAAGSKVPQGSPVSIYTRH